MTRTLKYKLLYAAVVAAGLALVAMTFVALDLAPTSLLVAAVLLLVPGRVGAYFLRDLFLSRRNVAAGRYEDGVAAAERFLQALNAQPWRQHFIYCFFGFYTWNTRAMALNNLGAAKMELGRYRRGGKVFGRGALTRCGLPDPLLQSQHHPSRARRSCAFGPAAREGKAASASHPSAVDKVIMRVGAAYARVQSFPS